MLICYILSLGWEVKTCFILLTLPLESWRVSICLLKITGYQIQSTHFYSNSNSLSFPLVNAKIVEQPLVVLLFRIFIGIVFDLFISVKLNIVQVFFDFIFVNIFLWHFCDIDLSCLIGSTTFMIFVLFGDLTFVLIYIIKEPWDLVFSSQVVLSSLSIFIDPQLFLSI